MHRSVTLFYIFLWIRLTSRFFRSSKATSLLQAATFLCDCWCFLGKSFLFFCESRWWCITMPAGWRAGLNLNMCAHTATINYTKLFRNADVNVGTSLDSGFDIRLQSDQALRLTLSTSPHLGQRLCGPHTLQRRHRNCLNMFQTAWAIWPLGRILHRF